MLTEQFLADFRNETEAKWAVGSIDPNIFGFQFQRGTRWLPGLSNGQINAYERAIGVRFPHDLRMLLRVMNGTDLPTVNVYGSEGEEHRESVGVYSYPRDVNLVRDRMDTIRENRTPIADDLASQGFELDENSSLVPIFGHRYVVSTPNLSDSVVLSIVVNDVDAIVYGNSLEDYLIKEFIDPWHTG